MRRRRAVSSLRAVAVLAVLAAVVAGTACRDEAGVVVAGLSIAGNEAFSDRQLEALLVTRDPGFLPWSRRDVFDQGLFEADLGRIEAFYAERGFPDARVVSGDVDRSADGSEVRLRVRLQEGQPVRISEIVVNGLAGLPPELAEAARHVPLETGDRLDRTRIAAARDRVSFALRDRGYADARVTSREEAGDGPRRVRLVLDVDPGDPARFGPVSFVGLAGVSPDVVARTLTFRPGQPYREGQLLESERRLFGLGLFDFTHVAADPDVKPGAEQRPVIVTVKEGKPTTLRFGVGYGTEDGPRGSFEWGHRNLFGGARQLTTTARYSARLAGGAVDFVQPYVGRGQSVGATGGAWWRDEPIFTSRSVGVRARWTAQLGADRGPARPPLVRAAHLKYSAEHIRYTIAPEALEDPAAVAELVTLGIDPSSGRGSGRLAMLSLDFEQSAFDNPVDPHRGYGFSAHAARAARWLGGTFVYSELQGDASVHLPLGPLVWATRARAGALVARTPADVPFSVRYFLGGSTSLRGWSRFEVSPVTADGLPIGGLGVFEISSELRAPLTGSIGLVGFVDAGNVWAEPADIRVNDLRADAGIGVRYVASFGVIRADIGVQLTPIAGLLVDGRPQRHRWRIHFGLGHAF